MGAGAPREGYQPEPLELASGRRVPLGRKTLVMGVVNTTPDSFYAGSRTPDPQSAIQRALAQIDAGADIIDIGGESTRPGAEPVSDAEQIARVTPVIAGIRKASEQPISIDTTSAAVAQAAIRAGADIVNDVSGLAADPQMGPLVAATGAVVIVMHTRGTPKSMQAAASYQDVVLEVKAELGAQLAVASRHGIPASRQWIDPGIGFAKSPSHNLVLLRRLAEFQVFERPLLVGASRKSFIGHVLDEPDPSLRLEGSLAAATFAASRGAHIVRVHDVAETVRSLRVIDAILKSAHSNSAISNSDGP